MSLGRQLKSLAVAACVGLASAGALAQPAGHDEAARTGEMSDAKIDAMLLQDQNGLKGSGERFRLLAELNPEIYAQLRRLTRRLHLAPPDGKAAVTSEMIDLGRRMRIWFNAEIRRAPLDALDGLFATLRKQLPAIRDADPRFCTNDPWDEEWVTMALDETRPDLNVEIDVASLRAVAAARARPAAYRAIDETMSEPMLAAFLAAGVTEDEMTAVFSEQESAKLAPEARCDLSRRTLAALAALPDHVRGPLLVHQFSGDDGAPR